MREKQGEFEKRGVALACVVQGTAAEAAVFCGRHGVESLCIPDPNKESYGLTGGHIFHGELALDQLFTMRPLLGWARYATPIQKLYLCGSGTHPGTGLTGISGANAAREILKRK